MNNNNWTSKLKNSNYDRPKQTYTDKLTDDDILDKLDGYRQIDDINKVQLGTHLRYFQLMSDGEKKFRMGGFLFKNDGIPDYVILNNNKSSWSVQIDTAIFFRKLSQKEIVEEYENKIDELENKNKALKTLVKDLKSKLKKFNN